MKMAHAAIIFQSRKWCRNQYKIWHKHLSNQQTAIISMSLYQAAGGHEQEMNAGVHEQENTPSADSIYIA